MELILSQDIKDLGTEGQVVNVKDGYARNYLLPKKLAFLATPGNLRKIEEQQKIKQAAYEKAKKEASDIAEQLNKVSCTVNVEVNDLDKLYGAVSDTEIVKSLEAEGFTVDKNDLIIDSPIEELGIFDVGIKLHPEVTAKIRLWVTKK